MLGRFSRFLMVDDSPVARKIMRMMLTNLGFDNVDEAHDGRQALSMLAMQPYRIVLSDWDMAPVNGLELLRAMRADTRFAQVPFIMVTAQSTKKFIDVARDHGATHYLTKPFTTEMLAERIARVAAPRAA